MTPTAAMLRVGDHLADAFNRGGAALVALVRLVLAVLMLLLFVSDVILQKLDRYLSEKSSATPAPDVAFDGVQVADLERIG